VEQLSGVIVKIEPEPQNTHAPMHAGTHTIQFYHAMLGRAQLCHNTVCCLSVRLSKFTAASRGSPCDSMAFLYYDANEREVSDNTYKLHQKERSAGLNTCFACLRRHRSRKQILLVHRTSLQDVGHQEYLYKQMRIAGRARWVVKS